MLKNYLKIALRNLRTNRTYTFLNILGLGMGMTSAILIFLFLQYHLSTDGHHANFDRTYRVVLDLLLDEGTESSSDASIPLATALSMDYSQIEAVGFVQKIPDATLASSNGKNVKIFAVLISFPLVVLTMYEWLENYAYRIDLDWTIFASIAMIFVVVIMVLVCLQTYKAAMMNRVKAIKVE
jgi:putative ABC transport system permease protein